MRTSGSGPVERPEGRKEQGILPQGKKECKRQLKGERNMNNLGKVNQEHQKKVWRDSCTSIRFIRARGFTSTD